jgi:D-threo-aldose 1-dehydrogenase
MQLIVPGLSTPSTHLGYGCSQLMGGITRRESIALLETAFDSGIRHFDTAPSYGYGEAESVLGEALRSKRSQVTITTKFGIRPPRNQSLLGLARRVLLPLVNRVPSIKSRLSQAAGGLKGRAGFSPDELRGSIEASLAALATDHIDIFLLHEAVVGDLTDELFAELERNVKAGKIRSFGIGSEATAAAQVYRHERRFCPIMQFEWSVLSGRKPTYPGSFLITHRSLSENFVRLRAWLGANPAIARAWSKALDADVTNGTTLSRLMLAAARDANRDGITLFSSRNLRNIGENARLMRENSEPRTAAALAALIARDATSLLQPRLGEFDRQVETVS